MKKLYGILDLESMHIVRTFEDEATANERAYEFRKRRYQDEHPNRPFWEYDTMKHDNGFYVIKYEIIA